MTDGHLSSELPACGALSWCLSWLRHLWPTPLSGLLSACPHQALPWAVPPLFSEPTHRHGALVPTATAKSYSQPKSLKHKLTASLLCRSEAWVPCDSRGFSALGLRPPRACGRHAAFLSERSGEEFMTDLIQVVGRYYSLTVSPGSSLASGSHIPAHSTLSTPVLAGVHQFLLRSGPSPTVSSPCPQPEKHLCSFSAFRLV